MSIKAVALSLLVWSIPAPIMAQAVYTVTDLGPLSPTGINSWAQVVGNYNNQGYLWAFGSMRSLGKLPGGTFSSAAAINDLGVVTGTADGPGTVVGKYGTFQTLQCSDLVQPFIWKQTMTGLGTVGFTSAFDNLDPQYACRSPFYAEGINNVSQIVGATGWLTENYAWAFLWTQSGGMTRFGSSYPPSFANAISDSGQIVGQDRYSAVSWNNGVETELQMLSDFPSAANGINILGQIVGWGMTTAGCPILSKNCFHAALWLQDGTVTDLGTLPGDAHSTATKINAFGLVIGSSGNSTAGFILGILDGPQAPLEVLGRPFIWSQRTGMLDLNTLISPRAGWVLTSARDINCFGQIVGDGIVHGQVHGYLLTPRNPFKPL